MSGIKNNDPVHKANMSPDLVWHYAGPVTDHTVTEILETRPTEDELIIAVMHARSEEDIVEAPGHPLLGTAARIYQLLMQDEYYQSVDEGKEAREP